MQHNLTKQDQLPLFALSRGRTGELEDRNTNPSFPKAAEVIEIVNVKGDELTLFDRKLYNTLLFNAYPDLAKKKFHQIPVKSLRGTHKSADRVTESVERLMRTIMRINYFDRKGSIVQEGSHQIQLLGPTKIEGRVLHYRILEDLIEVLSNPRIYGRINFGVLDNLNSKYGLILYELLQARLHWLVDGVGTWLVTVDHLRNLFECVDKFQNFKDFRIRVLQMAVDDVNKNTEWQVEWTETKRGRAVHSIQFTFRPLGVPAALELDTPRLPAYGGIDEFITTPVVDNERNRSGIRALSKLRVSDLERWYQMARQSASDVEGYDILISTKRHQIGQWVHYVVDELENAGLLDTN